MYTPSINYSEYIEQSRIRKPKSKIIVDGKEYTGETALKTYPKISHFTSDALGVFPAKTCEFEIYNKDGSLNLNGKEVTVYRGLDIDGTVEWIPMGLFSGKNEDITSNFTSTTITFKGYDRTLMFDVPFNPLNHTYPCTLGAFAKRLCENHAIPLETESFPFSDLILNQAPVVTSKVTERELISRIAELGGCIAQISRSGGLRITKPTETAITVLPEKYKNFSYEKVQLITKVVISQTDSEDVSKTADSETIGTYGTVVYHINDNPFIFDRQSEVISSVAAEIIGLQTRAFILNDFIDDFLFDLNDIISVKDKNENEIKVILRSLQTQSRMKSNFSAGALKNAEEEKTSLAGSQKQQNEQQKESLKIFEEQMQQAMQDMSKNINNALGLYSTEYINEDGSKVIYYHDKSSLETSTYIFTVNAEGFAWVSGSGCWNGGTPDWQYGIDTKGGGILSTLLVREITANIIKTGILQSANSPNTYYDLDKGKLVSVSEKTESVTDVITGEIVKRTTRWEISFCNGCLSIKTYINDTLVYILTNDNNGIKYDQTFFDSLSDAQKRELIVPMEYYEKESNSLRNIYWLTYKTKSALSGFFGDGYYNIIGQNSFMGLSLHSLRFSDSSQGDFAVYGINQTSVQNVSAGKTLTVRDSNVFSLGKPDGVISSGEYLSQYTTPGIYAVNSNSLASSLFNQENSDMPIALAGKLIVASAASNSSSDGSYHYLIQNYHPYQSDRGFYIRWLSTQDEPDVWTISPWKICPTYDSKPVDYITEQGKSGNWYFRKWNSGIAECWGMCSIEVAKDAYDWNSGIYCASGYGQLPSGIFSAVSHISATPTLWYQISASARVTAGLTIEASVFGITSNITGLKKGDTVEFNCSVTGKWK